MMPSPDDMRRLNPSSAARWDACRGRGSPNYIVGQSDIDKAEASVHTSAQATQRHRDRRDHAIELLSIVGVIAGVSVMVFANGLPCVMGGLVLAVVSTGSFAITCFISGNRHKNDPEERGST